MNLESNRITCKYDWIYFNYCPNIIDVKIMHKKDGGNTVFSYTNNIGQRIPSLNAKLPEKPRHIFIGDSMMQAEEMTYEETFYGLLSDEFEVSTMGYSSWNIIQYYDAILKVSENINHKVDYHVFLHTNDISPFDRSVYYETNVTKPKKIHDTNVPSDIFSELKKGYNNSLTKTFFDIFIEEKFKALDVITSDLFNEDLINDCSPLKSITEPKTNYSYGYFFYSKAPECWDKPHKDAAEMSLKYLKKIVDLVKKLNKNSKVTFYMVADGFRFPFENTSGRKNNYAMVFGDEITVTNKPLIDFFSKGLPGTDFIDLGEILEPEIEKCINCVDQFWYSVDGHMTSKSHYILYEYFKENLKK